MEHSAFFSSLTITTFALYALLIVALVLTVRFFSTKSLKENSFSLLQKKLEAGEIDIHEFEQRKRQLQKEEDLKMKSFFLSRT